MAATINAGYSVVGTLDHDRRITLSRNYQDTKMIKAATPTLPTRSSKEAAKLKYGRERNHRQPLASSENFEDDVRDLRKRACGLPDDYLICLVGDMITEEALPAYQTMLNTFDGVRDETGASPTSWALWTRMWTAEENRHGDVLYKYLYLTGRVDMKQIEKTIQYLIGYGM
ncbi:hypothetical protein KI387_040600, partial [Taxus chinensis]